MEAARGDAGVTGSAAPTSTVERLLQAINAHDLDALVDCFDPNYRGEQPAHPDRSFDGREQVRANWTRIFTGVPDIEATLVRWAEEGETVWAEWSWRGTGVEGTSFAMAGVTVQGVADGRIVWARLYLEPVGASANPT